MNVGLVQKRRPAGRQTIAELLAKGTPGPLGNDVTQANPKDVSKEAQSIRLSRLLVRK